MKPKTKRAAEVTYNAMQAEYQADERRGVLFVSKVQTLATVAAIVFVGVGIGPTTGDGIARSLTVVAIAFGLPSVLLCAYVLLTMEFQRLSFTNVLNEVKELNPVPGVVRWKLSGSYRDAIVANDALLVPKLRVFNWATYLVIFACAFKIISVLIPYLEDFHG
jgi:hypothetical protein